MARRGRADATRRELSEAARGVVRGLLTLDPEARLTAEGVRAHAWLAEQPREH